MPTILPPRKNKWRLFLAAAADTCSRKRDTLFYGVALPAAAASEHFVFASHYTVNLIPSIAAAREFIRGCGWLGGSSIDPSYYQYMRASFAAGMALLTGQVFILEIIPNNGIPLSAWREIILPVTCMGYGYNVQGAGLTAKGLFRLYKSKLFDYHDKNDPKGPRSGGQTALHKLLDRLRAKPILNPI